VASWPGTLPQAPDFSTFQETSPNVALRTQMDVGPPKLRRRSTAGIRPFTMSFLMTQTQVATLETFYQTTLTGGTAAFDWTHPRTGSAASFRFVTPPQYHAIGPITYRVSCQMEILP